MIVSVLIILAVATFIAYYNRRSNKHYWRKVNKIRGIPTLPIIGNIYELKGSLSDAFNSFHRIWERCDRETFKLHLGSDVYVFLSTPECVETILKHSTQIEKMHDFYVFSPLFGNSVISLTGDVWRQRRKLIMHCFHHEIFKEFVHKFNRHSQVFAKRLEGIDETFDVFPMVKHFGLDSLCDTAMGRPVGAQNNLQSAYGSALERLGSVVTRRMISLTRFKLWFLLSGDSRLQDECVKIVNGFTDEVIDRRREEIASGHLTPGKTFLDALLLSEEPLTHSDIRDEVKTFIFAGHDTTSSAISFLAYSLSKNPQVQDKIFAEQRKIFGEDLYRSANISDLDEMRYLECAIKETLRMYPSVGALGRSWNEDTALPDGTELPAGVNIVLYIYGLGRNPKYDPNPDQFDPSRFEGNDGTRSPFAFVPFSAGPRSCIGQKFAMLEMKTFMSTVCRRYTFSHPGPEYEPQLFGAPTLRSNNGIHLRVHPR